MNPRVSVLTCVYNDVEYLPQALNSVLENGFDGFELILVDDGSTDGTKDLVRRFTERDARIHALFKTNSGLTDSLNVGLRLAKGEYIARLDADDYMLPGRLQTQVDFLEDHHDVTLLGSDARLVNAAGEIIGQTSLGDLNHAQCVERLMTMEAFFAHSSWVVRREALVALGGYDPFYRKAQDYELMLRLSQKGQLASLGIPLIALRKHEESVSYDEHFLQYKYALTALVQYHQRLGEELPLPNDPAGLFAVVDEWVSSSGFDRLMLGQRHFSFAWYDLKHGSLRGVLHHLARALQADPLFLLHRQKQSAIRCQAISHLVQFAKTGD